MFQVVETPIALPGSCYFCGSGDKSPYIDWGVSIDFHGALYTCFECTGAVASLLGWVPREVHARVIETSDELIARNLDLEIENRELHQAIEHLSKAGFVIESIPDSNVEPSGTVGDIESDILAVTELTPESTQRTGKLVDAGKRAPDESSNDKGVDELHSDDSSFKLSL